MRVSDWKALRALSDHRLLVLALGVGVTRYRVYRNIHDASQALLVLELPGQDALALLDRELDAELVMALNSVDERIWEPCEWQVIG
jgi:hypothetical protein